MPDQRQLFDPTGQESLFDQEGRDQLADLDKQATPADRLALRELVTTKGK